MADVGKRCFVSPHLIDTWKLKAGPWAHVFIIVLFTTTQVEATRVALHGEAKWEIVISWNIIQPDKGRQSLSLPQLGKTLRREEVTRKARLHDSTSLRHLVRWNSEDRKQNVDYQGVVKSVKNFVREHSEAFFTKMSIGLGCGWIMKLSIFMLDRAQALHAWGSFLILGTYSSKINIFNTTDLHSYIVKMVKRVHFI